MTTEATLKDKLRFMVKQRLRATPGMVWEDGLTVMELESLVELLEEQVVTAEPAGGYRVTYAGPNFRQPEAPYGCMGPGISSHPHDIPQFTEPEGAASMARCLSRAFRAGESHRAAAFAALLEPRW